ncbi:MAG: polymerase sigma factor [Blastococcus sp.]|nr:polymerase sigma factor [Blastococcus sp.]
MTEMLIRQSVRPPATASASPSPSGGAAVPEEALRGLYRDHAAALLAFAQRYTRDRMEAEDAVQETFVRAWRHLPDLLADDRPLRPWLRKVLRRVLIDAARVTRAHPVQLTDDPGADREVDGGYDALVDRSLLAEAIGHLSPAHRQVLVESYYRDVPAERIATALGIPVGTVRSRLHYALLALRRQLSGWEPLPA